MLWAIPDLKFALLNGSDVYCGGAGVYNLLEPQLSQEVLGEKLKNIADSGAEVLATGNPGCQMQISAGARLAGLALRVCHPVELLDESYARSFSPQARSRAQRSCWAGLRSCASGRHGLLPNDDEGSRCPLESLACSTRNHQGGHRAFHQR